MQKLNKLIIVKFSMRGLIILNFIVGIRIYTMSNLNIHREMLI